MLSATPNVEEYLRQQNLMGWHAAARSLLFGDRVWTKAAEAGLCVPKKFAGAVFSAAVAGRPFGELANPFAPLLAIVELGYFCEEIDQTLGLVAHPL